MRRFYRISTVLGIMAFLCPFAFYWNKPVHVSIDDVMVLERLSDGCIYKNVFDDPFLHCLREYHNSTGARFTLYIYETSVKEISNDFWNQIRDNSDWLKIGWHGISAEQPQSLCDMEFVSSFFRFDSILTFSAPENKTSTLRLHYWEASPWQVSFLERQGTNCLLTADRKTVSYSLAANDIECLEDKEIFKKGGITYKKTDFRVENTQLIPALLKNAKDEELVVFTHEWAISSHYQKFKFKLLLAFFWLYGSSFVY